MIGTDKNILYRCDSEFRIIETIMVQDAECINAVRYTDDDEILISTDKGVLVYSDGVVRKQQLLLDNSVDDMYVDYEGNYWFISSRKGIVKVSNSRFFNITHSVDIQNIVANAVLMDKERLYIGHDSGLEIVDLTAMNKIHDSKFDILCGVRIRDIFEDSKGRIWFCTKEHGLLCYQKDGIWKEYLSKDYATLQTDSFRILGILENEGTYYLGTDGYGMFEIQNKEVKKIYTAENGLLSNVIMKFRKSIDQEAIWMVTGNNIACLLKDGTILNVDNLPFTNILDFILQEDGTVWILTGGGIYKMSEHALLTQEISGEVLSRIDGEPFECTANARQYMEGDTLYVCGTEGVFRMKLADAADKYDNYPLTIDYIAADDELCFVENTDVVKIAADVKRISIQPHVPSFIPENPSVFYYLDDFDRKREIVKLKDLDEIIYTNLDGKEYLFHFV